jgi:hypothetical protein
MKEYRTKEGPFPLRLHYETKDIDDICLDALREVNLLPSEPSPIKIDLFLEKYFKVVVDYRDLGPGIMGSTVFNSKGAVTGIIIAPWIEEEGTDVAERRVRSTLAHEGGHGLLHPRLFIVEQTGDLFGRRDSASARPTNFLCRSNDISPEASAIPKYDGKWWEWQANRAIGGLLLPRSLVKNLTEPMTEQTSFGKALKESLRAKAVREVAETFEVNPVVARIRLQEIFPVEKNQKFQ